MITLPNIEQSIQSLQLIQEKQAQFDAELSETYLVINQLESSLDEISKFVSVHEKLLPIVNDLEKIMSKYSGIIIDRKILTLLTNYTLNHAGKIYPQTLDEHRQVKFKVTSSEPLVAIDLVKYRQVNGSVSSYVEKVHSYGEITVEPEYPYVLYNDDLINVQKIVERSTIGVRINETVLSTSFVAIDYFHLTYLREFIKLFHENVSEFADGMSLNI